jgi:ATP-binding cassette subfamily F protein 3
LVADRLWLVADGGVAPFDGDLLDYRKLLLDKAREARRGGGGGGGGDPRNRKEERRAAAENRAQLAPLRKKVQEAEKKMERLGTTKATLEARLADPKLYDGPPEKVTALQKEIAETAAAIGQAEAAWLEANETLEAAKG